MTRILIILLAILAYGCHSKQKNNFNELESEKTLSKFKPERIQSIVLLDTLVFNDNTNGESLSEKYIFGLTKLKFYQKFVSENKINEKQILTEEHSKTEITYLGKLMDLDKQNFYHIITNFKIIGIGEMLSPRGISNVAFLSDDLSKIIIYRMDMPNELPNKIDNNTLYFTINSEQIGILVSGGLSPMLCIPEIGCY